MLPTLEQIKRLNQLLTDWYYMGVSPSSVIFSEEDGKPRVLVIAEPIHEAEKARWFIINWKGEIDKSYE